MAVCACAHSLPTASSLESSRVRRKCESEMASMRAFVLEGKQRVEATDREMVALKKEVKEATAKDEAAMAAMEATCKMEVEALLEQVHANRSFRPCPQCSLDRARGVGSSEGRRCVSSVSMSKTA